MHMSATTVRRGLFGMFAGGLLAFGSAAIVMPVANAAPDSCTQSGIATTASTVSATYSGLSGGASADQPGTDGHREAAADQAQQAYQAYFDRNPQVENELQAINQPATDLSAQCGITVTPTPISEVLQTL